MLKSKKKDKNPDTLLCSVGASYPSVLISHVGTPVYLSLYGRNDEADILFRLDPQTLYFVLLCEGGAKLSVK